MSPVRQVSGHGGNVIGRFPSLKMKRMISFESLIECDFLYLLEYEPTVDRFYEQPLTIEYGLEGRTCRYTPDFQVVQRQSNRLVECKPAALVHTEDNRRKFAAALEWCQAQGWEFCLVTDQDLRTGPRLANIKLLTRYARHVIRPEIKARVSALLHSASTALTVGNLAQALAPSDPASALASILHLAFHHELWIAVNEAPITVQSQVRLPRLGLTGGE